MSSAVISMAIKTPVELTPRSDQVPGGAFCILRDPARGSL